MSPQWLHNPRVTAFFRLILVVVGVACVILTAAFYQRTDLARSIWPWSYYTLSTLSYTFLASITIAIALPVLWIGVFGEIGATFGGAINLTITFLGSTLFILQSYSAHHRDKLLTAAVVCGLLTLFSLSTCFATWSFGFRDTLPMPRFVRRSFAVLGTILIVVGSGLVLKQQMFPWRLSTEATVIYGWIFLGAAAYFWYGFFRPVWGNASGQYLGFLAYDLILIVPFIQHLDNVQSEHRLSLYIYLIVIIFTAITAVYYLFVVPKTRLWRRQRADA